MKNTSHAYVPTSYKDTACMLRIRDDGSMLVTCTHDCLSHLLAHTDDMNTRPMARLIMELVTPPNECLHCSWCGRQVYYNLNCYLHEDQPACPLLQHKHPLNVE